MANEAPLPMGPVTDSVSNYGAVGDGKTDCTAAFKAAIANMRQGVLYVPPGEGAGGGEWGRAHHVTVQRYAAPRARPAPAWC